MKVAEVVELARGWVQEHVAKTPGFVGAHLKGGILDLDREGDFPLWRDVDVNVVVAGQPGHARFEDVVHHGLLLDVATYDREVYASPEGVLANPALAPNLARGGVIVDPRGELQALRRAVAAGYCERRWVLARIAGRRRVAAEHLGQILAAREPAEIAFATWHLAGALSALVALAHLEAPTHRCSLAQNRRLLEALGRLELHEAMLALLGFDRFEPAEVEGLLAQCTAAFDRAVLIVRPRPAGDPTARLIPEARSYVVEGAREMLDAGWHREAMFWIAPHLFLATQVIERHAPLAERAPHLRAAGRLLERMEMFSANAAAERHARGQRLARELDALAERVVARDPRIVETSV